MKKHSDDYVQIANLLVRLDKFNKDTEVQPNGCIHYTGLKHKQGYGFVNVLTYPDKKRKMMTSHRLQMTIKENRELSFDEKVIHTCGNPLCVNVDHLFIGNLFDKVKYMKLHNKFKGQKK